MKTTTIHPAISAAMLKGPASGDGGKALKASAADQPGSGRLGPQKDWRESEGWRLSYRRSCWGESVGNPWRSPVVSVWV